MNIIKCPYCILQGLTKNLAEILPNGDIKILRMIKEDRETFLPVIDFTIVRASEFQLLCGHCGNVVIYKQPIIKNSQVNIMLAWGTIQNYYEKTRN